MQGEWKIEMNLIASVDGWRVTGQICTINYTGHICSHVRFYRDKVETVETSFSTETTRKDRIDWTTNTGDV